MGQELLTLSVASLRAAYPNANLPAETVAIYTAALEDLDPQDVQEATIALIRSSVFPPTVAEIRRRVAETLLGLPGPIAAWEEAVALSENRWGTQERNPLVKEALQALGGTWAVRTSENPIATRAQFLKFYAELRDAKISGFVQTGVLEPAPQGASQIKASAITRTQIGERLSAPGTARG